MVLILCYTGVRISELLDLKKENVNLEEHYFNVFKSKTESVYTHIEMSELIEAIDSVYYPEEIIKEVKKSRKEIGTMRYKNFLFKQKILQLSVS